MSWKCWAHDANSMKSEKSEVTGDEEGRVSACPDAYMYPLRTMIAKSAERAIPARIDGTGCCAALRDRKTTVQRDQAQKRLSAVNLGGPCKSE